MSRENDKRKIIVIGAGAAGMMAAAAASAAGCHVTLYEKNEKPGKKIYITGKGRCNFTNMCDTSEFFEHVIRNPKFLYSAVYGFDQQMMADFLERNGCRTKVERGKRAFPESDHASDVTKALERSLREGNVRICLNTPVKSLIIQDGKAAGVKLSGGPEDFADAVIVCTGGLSYPSTGSTGDGYRFCEETGIETTPRSPSLVPFVTDEEWVHRLQGLSLRNISVSMFPVKAAKKKRAVYSGFGELLFTHFGLSGPLILSASAHADFIKDPEGYILYLDLKPAVPGDEFHDRVAGILKENAKKTLGNALRPLFPERLAEAVAELYLKENGKSAGEPENAPKATVQSAGLTDPAAAARLCSLIHALPVRITGTRGYAEAVVTRGGVCVKEINPSTMESKKINGLYFAGEVIDTDAVTGGFNLQIAWSTGHLAGESAAADKERT